MQKYYYFTNEDVKGIQTPHNDAVVVSMTVAKLDVNRILVNN